MSLMDEMDSDLQNVFFNEDDFAIDAVYYPSIGGSYHIKVIFDSAYESVNVEGTIPIASTAPVLRVREADINPAPAPGDVVLIKSVRYGVIEPEPDGHGVLKLRLNEAMV